MIKHMDQLFAYDPNASGTKGLVFIGDKVLVYRRDENTSDFPLCLDLPGGGIEDKESPYEAFERELKEEFDLNLKPEDVSYCRAYSAVVDNNKTGYFVVAKLPMSAEQQIKFGNEGLEYMLMTIEEYLSSKEAIPAFQKRIKDYLRNL